MTDEELRTLGPLAVLVGVWEGKPGRDLAPDPAREPEDTPFSERMVFESIGLVDNHEQLLWGLRYRTEVKRLSNGESFHEELGYWLWDAEHQQVMRCFVVPRGVSVLAGGSATADARSFRVEAVRGSSIYGVVSNAFLDEQFRIERFTMNVTLEDDGAFRYDEDTVMRMPGREELFHHTDACVLRRVEA